MASNQKIYDAVVVGSGASGGWVAKELCEQGMMVLLLEAGPPRLPTRDFTEHVWPYQVKFRGFSNQQALLENQPVQRLCFACDEFSHQFFVNDHENPYTFPPDKPFMWIRGRQVGGRTFCWGRESYRYSDYEFKATSRDGYGEDWPISYQDLEPYYDKVESYIGVSGSHEGLESMPDGKFLPPMRLSCGGVRAREVIGKKFGMVVMPDRVANLTVAHNGRPACHYCDECQRGCHTASYFNSPSVTLPAAARTGRLSLVSDAVVSHVVMNAQGKAEGVYYVDRTTHAHREARAKVVVLAASALESTRILLNSRSSRFPSGLGDSTGQLGHYLMDHFTLEGAGGFMPQFISSQREPRGTPCGFLIAKYVNTGKNLNKNFLRGYRFDGDGSQELYGHAFGLPGFGPDLAPPGALGDSVLFRNYGPGRVPAALRQLRLARPGQERRLGHSRLTRRGELRRKRARHGQGYAPRRTGDYRRDEGRKTPSAWRELERFRQEHSRVRHGAHGERPEEKRGERLLPLHDAKNVFVTDGAVFVTQGCYEPTLTIMAISARAADYIADEYRKGNL